MPRTSSAKTSITREHLDPVRSAQRVGLRYVDDRGPGIRRRRRGKARDETKYEKMLDFAKVLPEIRARCERDLAAPGLARNKVLATVVKVLEQSFIRIGHEEYTRENQSFGLTTLRDQHARIHGATSERLGNTPSICRKCYVHPAVLEAYVQGHVLPTRAAEEARRMPPHLRVEEKAVVAFLRRADATLAEAHGPKGLERALERSLRASPQRERNASTAAVPSNGRMRNTRPRAH